VPDAQQSEIWWADLPRPAGRRPVLVLTRSAAIRSLSNVTIAPLTRTVRGIPAEVPLGPEDGVPTACAISLENILTVPKVMLRSRIAVLATGKMGLVFAAIRYVFAIPPQAHEKA
jgi:mRNA interferase MazF